MASASDTPSDNPGSILGSSSPANQVVHLSKVDKLVAIRRQWVTAVGYCGPSARSGLQTVPEYSDGLLRLASVPWSGELLIGLVAGHEASSVVPHTCTHCTENASLFVYIQCHPSVYPCLRFVTEMSVIYGTSTRVNTIQYNSCQVICSKLQTTNFLFSDVLQNATAIWITQCHYLN